MYKLIAYWTGPTADKVDDFEKEYWDTHIPLAEASPGLRRLVLTRTNDGLEGGDPAFYRIAELVWDTPEDFAKCAESPEWLALREDAGRMIEKYNVELAAGLGDEVIQPLGS
ncbi:MAG: EthD family reductase [Solirubrobacteraceae bacterium]